MSNSKKAWNASKAARRSFDANKKTIKVNTKEALKQKKKTAKLNYK